MDAVLEPRKTIGLVAHDNMKPDLVEWCRYNRAFLVLHDLVATGTTGTLLEKELDHPVRRLKSGPLGGDQQLGALIAEGEVDLLVFFWDPLEAQPHDPDVKALIRLAVVWNIPVACNRATADFLVSSPLMTGSYVRTTPGFRRIPQPVRQGLTGRRLTRRPRPGSPIVARARPPLRSSPRARMASCSCQPGSRARATGGYR